MKYREEKSISSLPHSIRSTVFLRIVFWGVWFRSIISFYKWRYFLHTRRCLEFKFLSHIPENWVWCSSFFEKLPTPFFRSGILPRSPPNSGEGTRFGRIGEESQWERSTASGDAAICLGQTRTGRKGLGCHGWHWRYWNSQWGWNSGGIRWVFPLFSHSQIRSREDDRQKVLATYSYIVYFRLTKTLSIGRQKGIFSLKSPWKVVGLEKKKNFVLYQRQVDALN